MKNCLSDKRYLFIVIFLSAFLLRLIYNYSLFINENNALLTDSGNYIHLAKSLYKDFQFPSVLRTPGYPFFIALIWWISHTQSIISVFLFQIILDSLTTVLVAMSGGFFSTTNGFNKMGAILYALNPLAIYYSGKIMSETLFIFLLALSLLLIKKMLTQENSRPGVCGASLAAGSAILTRPVAIGFYLLLFFFLLGKTGAKGRITLLKSVLIVSVLLMAWMCRNANKYHYFTLSTAGNYNLYVFGQNSYASAHQSSLPGVKEHFRQQLENKAKNAMGWRETSSARNLGLKLINENKIAFLKTFLLGTVKTTFQPPWGISQLNRMIFKGRYKVEEGNDATNLNFYSFLNFPYLRRLLQLPVYGILLWFYGLFYMIVLYFYGLKKIFKLPAFSTRLAYLSCIIFFLASPGSIGFSRFRLPGEFLIVS